MVESLVVSSLCSTYEIPSDIDKELMIEIGLSIQAALNDGFEASKTLHQPPIILTNNLIQKYGISLCLDNNVSNIVSKALCKAFMDGHAEGKGIRKFVDLTERSDDQYMNMIGRIIDTHAKPDHLAVLNYLT
ncbi:hypothetical protein NDJ00_11790 [Vibrio parahaemolyticus]|uniref:hypothetical protein n=1 Tax=Vibrio parahaemolyticus TaxID=670 RepID=UPI000A9A74E7|nr:hypothetical protein [Vibrio parahaemolyticus]MCS0114852.1 hypothetical protein [Vibrio parahaemolyticus]